MKQDFAALWAGNAPLLRREPDAVELAGGFPCGPLDRERDNEMVYRWFQAYRELSNVISLSGQTADEADLTQVWKAILAAIAANGAAVHYGLASGTATALVVATTEPAIKVPYKRGAIALVEMPPNLSIGTNATIRFGSSGETLALLRNDGSRIQDGDGPGGTLVLLGYNGVNWKLLTPGQAEFPRILGLSTLYVATNGNDANDGFSTQRPLLTIDAALKRASNYFTFAKPITIQLVKTGTTGIFPFPANQTVIPGSLIIRGDENAQANYILEGVGPSGGSGSVVGTGGQSVRLFGLTVRNTGTNNHTLSAAGKGSMEIEKVTLTSSFAIPQSHFFVSGSSSGTIGPGCRWASSAASMMTASAGDIAITTNASLFVDGNLAFSDAAAAARDFGRITARGGVSITTSGTVSGVRYRVSDAKINASGLGGELFPGDQPGVATGAGGYSM